ncbi:DUF6484 domain-containing protein [Aliikangiella maris]|uniref:DUF6484 domain-containing protein n=2 Tax=Aliikangiella maris TaxID=3162458 RepID=A0ABV3MNE4_9GAMM
MSVVKPFKKKSDNQSFNLQPLTVVGEIVSVNENGIAFIDYPQNTTGPIQARSVLTAQQQSGFEALPVTVLLVFEDADPQKPIITGIINETLFAPKIPDIEETEAEDTKIKESDNSKAQSQQLLGQPLLEEALEFPTDTAKTMRVDGKKVVFDAKEEILFQCGKSSILLTKSGRIIIKGTHLVSRSTASNKIKGSSVSIN